MATHEGVGEGWELWSLEEARIHGLCAEFQMQKSRRRRKIRPAPFRTEETPPIIQIFNLREEFKIPLQKSNTIKSVSFKGCFY